MGQWLKTLAHQTPSPKLETQNPHDRKREQALTGCPLISIPQHALTRAH